MKEFLIFYVGFTLGMCLMDYIGINENHYLHIYKHSFLHILLSLVFAPITFPFYLITYVWAKLHQQR